MFTARISLSEKHNVTELSTKHVVELCRRSRAEVLISRGERSVANGKKVNQVRPMLAEPGSEIDILAQGQGALRVVGELIDYFNHGGGI